MAYTHNYSEISGNPAGHPNSIQVVSNHLTGFALQISDEFVYSILQQTQRRLKRGWLICCATAKETQSIPAYGTNPELTRNNAT